MDKASLFNPVKTLYDAPMTKGCYSIIDRKAQNLLHRWVPKWHGAFHDPELGVFHERLTNKFESAPQEHLRLHPQCRHLAIYSHAARHTRRMFFKPDLSRHFEDLWRLFFVPETKGWRFSLQPNGKPKDGTYDLYGIVFVIFALTHYFRTTKDDRAHELAVSTLEFIDKNFRVSGQPGFTEALDENLMPLPRIRRQNPHMHLFEACLFAAENFPDPIFRRIGDEIAALFFSHFYDTEKGTLPEYYDDNLAPHPEKGHILEPGHYYEWIWLLKKHAGQKDQPDCYNDVCCALLDWANAHGWDQDYGGVYDEVAIDGTVLKDSKRLWPFTEGLKANALMLSCSCDPVKQERKDRIADMLELFNDKYIDDRGFWTEWLSRDLTPATDYMPASTPYHVYFGIMEAQKILRQRGRNKSWFSPAYRVYYTTRRALSHAIQGTRKKLVNK